MGVFKDKTGMKFGHLRVLQKCSDRDNHGNVQWLCECDCGNRIIMPAGRVGSTKMCKTCANKANAAKRIVHGGTRTRLYHTYKSIRNRCYNKNSSSYVWYGARGITVCPEWNGEQGFINFREWALNNGYSDDLTIERKDHEQGYSPENCTWIPMSEQAGNTRRSRMFTINGKTQHLAQWARDYNINYQTLHNRIQHGMDIMTALTKELRTSNKGGARQ